MLHEPIVVCRYGWGKLLRLYQNALNLNGTSYALDDLCYIRPLYSRKLGISSARLELQFKMRQFVLRGIVDLDAAHEIVKYLTYWCIPVSLNYQPPPSGTYSTALPAHSYPSLALEPVHTSNADCPLVLPALAQSGLWEDSPTDETALQEQVLASTVPIDLYGHHWQYCDQDQKQVRHEQRSRRLKRLQAERSKREHGFDREALALRLREEPLPRISVTPRLLDGEFACYASEATLYSESSDRVTHTKYRLRDQGTLILTNRRIIYLGCKRQIVIRLDQLLHFSHSLRFLELSNEHAIRRQIFEISRPLECAMYLEHLLQLFQQPTEYVPLLSLDDSVAYAYSRPTPHIADLAIDDGYVTAPCTMVPGTFLDTEKTSSILQPTPSKVEISRYQQLERSI